MPVHIKKMNMSRKEKNKTIGIAKKGWIYSTSIIAVIFWAVITAILFVDFIKGHYASVLKTIVVIVLLLAVFAVLSILSKNDKPKE